MPETQALKLAREAAGKAGRPPPFSPPTPRLQVGWPQSPTPSLPWTFCGSDCTKRSRRPGAR